MRTNIVLDDALVQEAMQYSSARSKRMLVHEALATFVVVKREEQKRASYQERLADVRRRVGERRMSLSAVEAIRADRKRDA
ncbi:type II toxin-antitoxin system VapB family antitoxin [Kiritimatiella glycovorans]|uniref:Uncharacterized protein n=1 Tax=Kiritimatiella glycovorans TaxID=1307763 RepID=A0A0G3EHW9_9BACT|nr:type II toxin-antitoxin system VapB family antitoxin [Kiritimatiella glycovorans]AKJ65022.1 hypothetical protein L21SP4_01785 [Kiritimatiella glycovorans]